MMAKTMRGIAAVCAALAALGLAGCAALPPIAGAPDASGGATAGTPAPAPAAKPALTSALAPHKVEGGWLFSFRAGAAQSVALAGDFNSWSTSANMLAKGDGDIWTIVLPLTPGDHQYKFVVNGSDWKPDPENPTSSDDGYGGKNSTVHVD